MVWENPDTQISGRKNKQSGRIPPSRLHNLIPENKPADEFKLLCIYRPQKQIFIYEKWISKEDHKKKCTVLILTLLIILLTSGSKLTQAGLVFCDFYLHNFTLMQLENLDHFPDLQDKFIFNVIWHTCCAIFFSLIRFGIVEFWPHFSCWRLAESYDTVMPLSHMCGLIMLVM